MSVILDPARWPDADELLDRALALPSEELAAFLREAAGSDLELLATLQDVLAEAASGDAFLEPGGALSGALGAEIAEATAADTGEAGQALEPGARIEQYEIAAIIGRGGMGEVYRARDTRLQRDVALKVLPDRLARDPERVARFRREARTLASLNHPGIGAIYGVAEDSTREALVLELVEGPTLAERLAVRRMPLDEALAIAGRLAEAIEAAHARGILHRDLKPANIKVLDDGAIKILDFGLAKALSPGPGAVDPDLSAPSSGLILGTAAYMSPEQIRGQELDERADIWAFGCVLFEMLTAGRAFPGDSAPEVLGRVLQREPDFDRLPPSTPESIRRLLRRCLEKNPRRRLGFVGDAMLEIADAAPPEPQAKPVRWPAGQIAAIVAAIAAIASVAVIALRPASAPRPVARFTLPIPSGDVPVTGFQPFVAVSPDGRTIVYRARRNGVVQLFRRGLQDADPVPIAGTDNGTSPFFSPDGRWLGFDSDGVLKRLEFTGGPPVIICDAPGGVTAAWRPDDTIVFATNTSRVLQAVPASGGQPAALTALDSTRGDTLHLLPQVLPDGRSTLFTIVSGASRHVAVRLDSGEVRVLVEGTNGRYMQSGHLVFWRDGSLWATRFDPRRLAVAGAAVPMPLDIQDTDNSVLHFDIAPDGSIVYLPAGEDGSVQRLVWFDRKGAETPVDLAPRPYVRIALSPDGSRLAFAMRERGNTDVWVADTVRDVINRLTFEPTIETAPIWSPDARSVSFRSEREGPGIFRRDAQGAGPIERLTETDGPIHSPYSWTPDGRTLLFAIFRSFRHQAIASVAPPDRAIRVLLDGNFAQLDPQVSRDSRWLAYQSDESGRFEVYVRPYPAVESGRWQVSTRGGTSPRWSPAGDELFFVTEEGLFVVPVKSGATFLTEPPRFLFKVKPFGGRLGADFEVSPDGRRFMFILDGPPAAASPAHLVFVQHWVEELRARLAEGR
jgi:Tol biopolymer transport system component